MVSGFLACTASPSGAPESLAPPVLGIDWGRTTVERPRNMDATEPPGTPGTHPILRIPGQANMADVVALPDGGFVAVGYMPPEWLPVSWTAADGADWKLHEIDGPAFTFPMSIAAGPGGAVVAVGRSGTAPAAWTTDDGRSWDSKSVPVLGGAGIAERMVTVLAHEGGYLAGGSVGPELLDRHARFWTTPDGATWEPVADDPVAFADSEVRAIAPLGEGFVAVGVTGTAQAWTGGVAWTSEDGLTWTRVDHPAFAAGFAIALTPSPSGGLVAVGEDLERREAVAWTSADGRTWARAPVEDSRLHSGGFAWFSDVIAIDSRLIAIGGIQGLQRGTAMSWVSTDGLTWRRSNRAPVQEQGEFYAIAAGGAGAVAVGSFGAPDSYVPTVWRTPAR